MKYKDYLENLSGRAGHLFHDHGLYYMRFTNMPADTSGPSYRISEVHDDFIIIKTENAETVKAENLTYVIPTKNLHIISL
jgi:hypothetical protein